jgi:hypothetical protein
VHLFCKIQHFLCLHVIFVSQIRNKILIPFFRKTIQNGFLHVVRFFETTKFRRKYLAVRFPIHMKRLKI